MLIFGCGGHARQVADTYLQEYPEANLIFVDANARPGELIFGKYPVLPRIDPERLSCGYHFGIGSIEERSRLMDRYGASYLKTIISKKAYVSPYAKLGVGSYVAEQAYIGPEVECGGCTVFNIGSVTAHEVKLGKFCQVGPHVMLNGKTKVGDYVFFGAHSSTCEAITIIDNTIVGSGAIVTRPILVAGTYFGMPAKKRGS